MPHIKELVIHGFKSFARETKIPFKDSLNCIVGPNGSGKSSKYDTIVTLANGKQVMLGKLVEDSITKSECIKKLDDGVYVDFNSQELVEIISLNKDTMKAEKKIVSKFIKREGEVIYKLKTRSGKEVEATGCHPIMVFNDGKVESSLIRDISPGSLVATPRIINIEGKDNFDKDIARLLGYIIGNGYIAKDRIEFVNKDKEVLDDFKKIIQDKFKVEIRERFEKSVNRIYIREKEFVKYVRDLFDENSKDSITSGLKKIPAVFFESNKEILSNILAGLYDTDGSVRKDMGIIEFCTKNKELANQVQGLLLRFGIASRIKKRLCCASNTLNKTKRDYYYYLYVYGKDNLKLFSDCIPLKVNYKKENLRFFAENKVESNPNTDILPQSVNFIIRDAVKDLGIKIKPIRKEYPSLCAYLDNRCAPTRQGISSFIALFETKLTTLCSAYENIKFDQINLINCMDNLHISGWQASANIGLSKSVIRNHWATNNFKANPKNLQKFYDFIKTSLVIRIARAIESINVLKALANSDIYWDKVISIEQLPKEEFVYDLTIEDNHNFIANNIFIHNSNVTDAICFVLGRLGSKSMRAKKLSNLIFTGTEKYKPAGEASVEIIFDNTDKGFSLDNPEISIKRILRKNGQGIYKINDEVKTRQEVLELLGQAGIDPNGFNIVLQGEIESFVRMSGIERKAIIEEVAGISVYEMRKKHSLQELEKTESRLKEANAILRERTAYLRNLEEERKQALHFKKLQEDLVNLKASVNYKMINEKEDKIEEINKIIEKEQETIGKINAIIEKTNAEIEVLNDKINNITQNIQKSSGLEQEKLNSEISDLRADLAGLAIKRQNYETQINDMRKRKEELSINIENAEKAVKEMAANSGKMKNLNVKKELEEKKKILEEIDEQRRKLYILKSNLSSLNSRVEDKQRQIQKLKNEYDFNFSRIEQLEAEVIIKETPESHKEKIILFKADLEKTRKSFEENLLKKHELEKEIAVLLREIENQNKIKSQVSSLDICPLCKTKITIEHINHVKDEAERIAKKSEVRIEEIKVEIKIMNDLNEKYSETATKIENEIRIRSQDCLRLDSINEKKEALRRFSEDSKLSENEFKELVKKKELLERDLTNVKTSETNYDTLRLEIQELQRHEELDVGMEVTLKQRDIERNKNILRQIIRETEENSEMLKEILKTIEEKQEILKDKNDKDKMLKEKFKKTLEEKNEFQEKIHMYERVVLQKQNEKHISEEKINDKKVERAQFLAQKEAIETEGKEFTGAKIVKMPLEELKQKIQEKQDILSRIGSVNMKALEAYDSVKGEYDKVQEKVNVIIGEKQEIINVIEEIDKKKKKAFNLTLEQINSLFSRNFSQLSVKGQAILVPSMKTAKEESKQEKIPGEEDSEGIDMLIKVGKGKYFDTNSLSGGEKTLISLSLIFAIQEYRPYCFYILDEIDAALDRRNSERLAGLLKKYMNKGQYIIITHNDSLITESPVIYGVTMQDKISKVVSLEV